tara:strand:+ start:275 stop:736 length:462 start_codon:yes stop_codon:yes gene_type:complete
VPARPHVNDVIIIVVIMATLDQISRRINEAYVRKAKGPIPRPLGSVPEIGMADRRFFDRRNAYNQQGSMARNVAMGALGTAAVYGLMKLLSKKKNSDNGGESRKEVRRTTRLGPGGLAYKKGGVAKKRNSKQMKKKAVKKAVRKAVHKKAGKR